MGKKQRTAPKRSLPVDDADSGSEHDIEGQDDFDFSVAQSFLETDLSGSSSRTGEAGKKTAEDREAHFEQTARAWAETVENDAGHLMVRDKTGKWINPRASEKTTESDSESSCPTDKESTQGTTVRDSKEIPPKKEWAKELATLAKQIIAAPEEHHAGLRRLMLLCESAGKDAKLRALSFGTNTAVYRDIIPAYPIRELTETEKATKVSKEVAAMRAYEQSLLKSYGRFIAHCKSEFASECDLTAFQSLVQLTRSVSIRSFNFFESILTVISVAAAGHQSAKIRQAACTCLQRLFEEDGPSAGDGRLTMLSVKCIAAVLRDRDYRLPDDSLFRALAAVQLRREDSALGSSAEHDGHRAAERALSHLSKKQRKEAKAVKKDATKKAIADRAESRKQQCRWARETRDQLFGILFGYVKKQRAIQPDTLIACLRAVGRHAGFLGVEYYAALTSTVKQMLESGTRYLALILACVTTVVSAGEAQDTVGAGALDLKFYHALLYRALRFGPGSWEEAELLAVKNDFCDAFSLLFLNKRQIPRERVAAFAHRLVAATMGTKAGDLRLMFVEQLRGLFAEHPGIAPLLDVDGEPLEAGQYLPNCDDPDICRPFCRPLDLGELSPYPDLQPTVKAIRQIVSKRQ